MTSDEFCSVMALRCSSLEEWIAQDPFTGRIALLIVLTAQLQGGKVKAEPEVVAAIAHLDQIITHTLETVYLLGYPCDLTTARARRDLMLEISERGPED